MVRSDSKPFLFGRNAVALVALLFTLAFFGCDGEPVDEPGGDGGSAGVAAGGSGGTGGVGGTGGDGGEGGAGGHGGTGGEGGTGGSGGEGGVGGTGGDGGGAPCTEETIGEPACAECLEEALPACEEYAETACTSELGAMLICAGMNSCLGDEGADFLCLMTHCRNASEAALRCLAECEAIAACVEFD